MKTKITNTEKTGMNTAIIIAVLFFIQASLIAGDNSEAKQDSNLSHDAYNYGTESSVLSSTGNTFDFLYEEAFESEMEIEEWMCHIHQDNDNSGSDEEEYELEEWMYNTHHSFWYDLSEAKEPEIAIENWMTIPDEWITAGNELVLGSK